MIATGREQESRVIEASPETTSRDEEKHETWMAMLPMVVVFGLWLFAQVWLVGPLLWRR